MLLARLADTWAALGRHPQPAGQARPDRRRPRRPRAAGDPGADLETVVSYLIGSLRQRRTGVGGRSLDRPARRRPPSADADRRRGRTRPSRRSPRWSGAGSVAARSAAVAALFGRATAAEQHFLRGLVFGELRQGASEAAVQEALAAAYEVPSPRSAGPRCCGPRPWPPPRCCTPAGWRRWSRSACRSAPRSSRCSRPASPTRPPRSPGPGCRPWSTPSSTASASRCTATATRSASSPAASTTSPAGCPRS